jgi:putative endonuclease
MMKQGFVYIMTNKPNGTLYIGVTNDLMRRVYEHKQKMLDGFTKKYGLDILVYYESYDAIDQAIHREKCMKEWKRAWKIKRILAENPGWNDLYEQLC